MTGLSRAALASLAGLLAVAAAFAVGKVRIDGRAHLLAADDRRSRALAGPGGDRAELEAAGRAYLRALSCYTPLDRQLPRAAAGVAATAGDLARAGDVAAARRLLAEAVAALDRLALLYVPLAGEREELAQQYQRLAPGAGDRQPGGE